MPKRDDFIGQNNPNVQIYAAENGLIPEYVDEAPIITEEDIAGLDNTAFANPYTRSYPCHTKVACVQSALWDAATNPGNELVTNNIRKMAAAHGVAEDVERIYAHFHEAFTKAAAPKPEPEPERTYALTLAHEQGQEQGYYETTYPQDVLLSAEEADKAFRAGNIGEVEFRKIASDLMEAATRHSIPTQELPRAIQTMGSSRLPDPYAGELIIRDFCKRSGVDPQPYVQQVEDLQGQMAQATDLDMAVKMANYVASKLVGLNLANGLTPGVQDSPFTLLFSGPERAEFDKRAANTVYIMDVPVPAEAVLSLPDAVISSRFAPRSAGLLKSAKSRLEQEDAERGAAAAELIAQMQPEARKQLLRTLSQM